MPWKGGGHGKGGAALGNRDAAECGGLRRAEGPRPPSRTAGPIYAAFPQVGPRRRDARGRNQAHGTCTNRHGRFVEVPCAVPRGEQIMEGRPEGKTLPSGLDCRGFPTPQPADTSRPALSGFARRGAQQYAPTVRPAGPSRPRVRAAREGRAMARPYVLPAATAIDGGAAALPLPEKSSVLEGPPTRVDPSTRCARSG